MSVSHAHCLCISCVQKTERLPYEYNDSLKMSKLSVVILVDERLCRARVRMTPLPILELVYGNIKSCTKQPCNSNLDEH